MLRLLAASRYLMAISVDSASSSGFWSSIRKVSSASAFGN